MDKWMVGKIAKCGAGRLGFVLDRVTGPYPNGQDETFWVGVGLDGNGPWTSRSPEVVFDNLEQYIVNIVCQLSPREILDGPNSKI